jgi:O6-methylguanine-DNA--protein-cysteine methyltransferase
MLDNASVTPAHDSAVIDEISLCIYQAILEIQQQQPELLQEKYRHVPWRDPRNRSTFLLKLKAGISHTQKQDALIGKVQKFLQILFIPSYFELPSFRTLMATIHTLTQQRRESSDSVSLNSSQPTELPTSRGLTQPSPGIAILLLDAENLQLDANAEKFLAEICTYPIQIKVAFANWRSMGKHDLDLHGRGYELIHVPAGKDSADVKMATVGSSIFVHYPTAKEVLVCSSDGVLTHLCTTLQTHGLTVYLVRKKADTITVLNSKTSQLQTYSLKPPQEIPSLEDFIVQLKELIKSEQKRTKNQWIKLARISSLFQEKYKFTLSQVVSHHIPGKPVRDVFAENPTNFVVHQLSERSELYISLFELSTTSHIGANNSSQQPKAKNQSATVVEISSVADLEQILVKMIEAATNQSPGSYIPITMLGTQFQRRYRQSVTAVLKTLQLNIKFSKFLQSCKTVELKLTDKGWGVALRKAESEDAIA